MLIIFLILLLLFVFFQDLKDREIYWFLPFLIFLTTGAIAYYNNSLKINSLTIIGAISIILFLWIYVLIRFKNRHLFQKYFGLGDALILIAIAPLFDLQHFFWFISFASILSLVLFISTRFIRQVKNIPFAGYTALGLILVMVFQYFKPHYSLIIGIWIWKTWT